MHRDTVLEYARATPFRPFRIVLTDGTSYHIRHHEAIRVHGDSFYFFVQGGPGQPHETFEIIGLSLIDRIEPACAELSSCEPPITAKEGGPVVPPETVNG